MSNKHKLVSSFSLVSWQKTYKTHRIMGPRFDCQNKSSFQKSHSASEIEVVRRAPTVSDPGIFCMRERGEGDFRECFSNKIAQLRA